MKHSKFYSYGFWVLFFLGAIFSVEGYISDTVWMNVTGSIYLSAALLVCIIEKVKLDIQETMLDIEDRSIEREILNSEEYLIPMSNKILEEDEWVNS